MRRKIMGEFKEILNLNSQDKKSIFDVAYLTPHDIASSLVKYMKTFGKVEMDVLDVIIDPFNPSVNIEGGSSIWSDGTYYWREDLVYFIENYRVSVPQDFISHVLNELSAS